MTTTITRSLGVHLQGLARGAASSQEGNESHISLAGRVILGDASPFRSSSQFLTRLRSSLLYRPPAPTKKNRVERNNNKRTEELFDRGGGNLLETSFSCWGTGVQTQGQRVGALEVIFVPSASQGVPYRIGYPTQSCAGCVGYLNGRRCRWYSRVGRFPDRANVMSGG